LRTLLSDRRIDYDGGQLRSGWLAEALGLAPDAEGAIAAFLGGCDVSPEFVVDREEAASGEPIRAALMLHFIAEFPERDLEKAVLRQRLLAAVARDELAARAPGKTFARRGDDLYEGQYKLSVSVATLAPASALVHFALDVDPAGARPGAGRLSNRPAGVGPRGARRLCARDRLGPRGHPEGAFRRIGAAARVFPEDFLKVDGPWAPDAWLKGRSMRPFPPGACSFPGAIPRDRPVAGDPSPATWSGPPFFSRNRSAVSASKPIIG